MVMGIDPGYATIGYAFLQGEVIPQLVDVGIISTKPSNNFAERLLEIDKNLSHLLKKHNPDSVAVEKLFFSRNQKTAINVAQARGAILLILAKKKLTIAEYTPLQVKKSITLKGNTTKKEVQWMTKKILNFKKTISQDDAADALALALTQWYKEN